MGILNISNKKKWNFLLDIKDSISGPQAIIGDFNEILHPQEKLGGTHGNTSRMHLFSEFIDDYHLLEVESFGLPFT